MDKVHHDGSTFDVETTWHGRSPTQVCCGHHQYRQRSAVLSRDRRNMCMRVVTCCQPMASGRRQSCMLTSERRSTRCSWRAWFGQVLSSRRKEESGATA